MFRIIFIFSLFLFGCTEHVSKAELAEKHYSSDSIPDIERIGCLCDPNADIGEKFPDQLCGEYKWPREYYTFGGLTLNIGKGNLYMITRTTDGPGWETDSGKFYFKHGILTILSLFTQRGGLYGSSHLHPSCRNILKVGQKIKLNKFALWFYNDKGKLDYPGPMLLKGKHWTFDVGLDSSGTGYGEEFSNFGKLTAQGSYENFKLKYGNRLYYDKKHKLSKFEHYEEGDLYDTITDTAQLSAFDKGYNE